MSLQRRLTIFQILEKTRFDTGSVHQMFQAACGLHDLGHAVVIISREDDDLADRTRKHGLEFHALPFRRQFDLPTILGLRRLFWTYRPDVVHVHKGLSHALGLLASVGAPLEAFVVNRGVSFPLTRWNRFKYRVDRVDRIVAVSRAIREALVASGGIVPGRVDVVYSGTDTEFFDPSRWSRNDSRKELGIGVGPEHFLITQVGVRDWKGWKELIEAFAILREERSHLRLVLAGCRSLQEVEKIRLEASLRGVAGDVSALGVRDDMPRLFAASDLVVDASWDGTGVTGTIREAMSMGRPVVATDCGGNRELVSSREIGWLVPPKKPAALVMAIEEVVTGPEHASATGRAARARVVQSFSARQRIERLEALYLQILDERHLPAL